MSKCVKCGSLAINPHLHGRIPEIDLNLCDVCYWRVRAEELQEALTPSASTKSFHIGEYSIPHEVCYYDEDLEEEMETIESIDVPWTVIKDIMKGIREYAHL